MRPVTAHPPRSSAQIGAAAVHLASDAAAFVTARSSPSTAAPSSP